MRFFIIFLYQIACIRSQDFQFATYTSSEAASQPSSSVSQSASVIENSVSNTSSQDNSKVGTVLDGLNSEGTQNSSNVGSSTQGTTEACTPGVLIGTFNLIVPNATSVFVSGSHVNITWEYSQYVTIMPNEIEIKYASISNSKNQKWDTIAKINGTLRNYLWTIPKESATDQFVIRLVPDQKETLYTVGFIGQAHCFGDGMVVPSSSNPFKIVTNIPLVTSPDTFGPRSQGNHMILPIFMYVIILFL